MRGRRSRNPYPDEGSEQRSRDRLGTPGNAPGATTDPRAEWERLAGRPIAGASVTLNSAPDDDKGVVHDYTVTARVPSGATRADVGLRVNTECGCTAGNAADIDVYGFTYSEGGGSNRVPNSAFASSMNGYGSWGDGKLDLLASDQGSGRMLHVTATKDQYVGLNSSTFAVTAGATFTFTVRARVVPGSFWTGLFGLFFLGSSGGESMRITMPFTIPQKKIGTATTDANGRFELTWKDVPSVAHHDQAAFTGTKTYWPSYSDGSTLTIP
jgi:hypothetical protein